MFRKVIFSLCVISALAQAQSNVEILPQPPITLSPLTSTDKPPTSSAPTTPTSPPTSSSKPTPKPTTPSPKPTPPPTTPSPKPTPSPTTPSPKPTPSPTTPSPKPTLPPTTPSPTPSPDGPVSLNNYTGNYTATDRICLMMKVKLQLEVLEPVATKINVTDHVNYNVSCDKNSTTEKLRVFWGNNSLVFDFFRNESKYEIRMVNATILLPGAKNTTTLYHAKPEFSVSDERSYKCVKDQPLNMTSLESNKTIVRLHITDLQYQAFMNTTKANYASAWYCDAANSSDVVPVVVGCILAVLVVLVLVAYLFGRRRCQARGYLSIYTTDSFPHLPVQDSAPSLASLLTGLLVNHSTHPFQSSSHQPQDLVQQQALTLNF